MASEFIVRACRRIISNKECASTSMSRLRCFRRSQSRPDLPVSARQLLQLSVILITRFNERQLHVRVSCNLDSCCISSFVQNDVYTAFHELLDQAMALKLNLNDL